MRFSIIIPVYNVEKYLRDCLDSVLGQSHSDWEAVCVNDGSTDHSASILEEYASRDIRITVISQPNGGLSAARNTGMNAAKGDYVIFLDSDDWLEPDALKTLYENLSGEDLLCFNGRRYFEDSGRYEEADDLLPGKYQTGWDYYSCNALSHRNFAFVCVVLRCYRRAYLLSHTLGFTTGIFHEDNLFTPLACFYAGKTSVITNVLYNYRVRSRSIMTSRSLQHWKDLIGTANELSEFFIPKKGIEKKTIYQALTHHYQVAFAQASPTEDKELLPLVNWELYKIVSGTKPRHRLNYAAMRICPRLFRALLKFTKR